MAEEFKRYLATEILSEQRTISYRNVSRALKVHVNAAKCMLYEFYEFQNAKKAGSVHATYLLCGTKKQVKSSSGANGMTNGRKHHYDEDEPIPSSPPPFTSSMLEPSQHSSQGGEEEDFHYEHAPVRTITLVREEGLEALKQQYETITSIHIYSLSPTRIQDLVTLTEIGRGLFTDVFTKEDPLLNNKTYGLIQNPNVRRRKGKRPVIPQGPPPKFQPVKDETKADASIKPSALQSKLQSTPKQEEASKLSARDSTSTTNGSAGKPALKRDSSDLFKAFAKQSQPKSKSTTSHPAANVSDTKMSNTAEDDDEGESEDESLFLDTGTRKPESTKKRHSDAKRDREDKAAKLRKMMESDDEDEPAKPSAEKPSASKEDPVASKKTKDAVEAGGGDDDEEVAWSDSDSEKQRKATTQEDTSKTKASKAEDSLSTEPRRRRGKRKVMKKRTMKDEDGYLVTREEAVWESYSEDDTVPAPAPAPKADLARSTPKTHNSSQSQSQASGKGAKSAGKKGAGGGNILSFFGKKA